jgi:putative holliday junction resolvase
LKLALPGPRRRGYHAWVRALAIDLGSRRIGLAVSDPSGILARPLDVIEARGGAQVSRVVDAIGRVAAEEDGLDLVVVGLPRRLDGTPNEQTAAVTAFVAALRRRITQPVVLQDERLSSIEAESRLAVGDRDWRSRKKKLDAAAAAVILQDYLDAGGQKAEFRIQDSESRRQKPDEGS